MSDSSTLSRLTRRAGADSHLLEGESDCEDLGCFGWLRGTRERALMLELGKRSGDILAIGYAWIERMEYDPAGAIVLHTPGGPVTVRGRNLNAGDQPLFSGLTRHRIPWLCEADRSLSFESERLCVVEALEW